MLLRLIATQFRKPSGIFGMISSSLMIKINQKVYSRLISDMDLQPGEKLLEIGYGRGIGIRMIAEKCPSCIIHGIDFSRLMYNRAGRFNRTLLRTGRLALQFGDFLSWTPAGKDYDRVYCTNVVYFWNELNPPFEKIFNLLKPGGKFHMYMADRALLREKQTPEKVFNMYEIEQVQQALQNVGFTKVSYSENTGYYILAGK